MSVTPGPWKGPRPQPFEPFSPAKWHGKEPPPYDWIVDGCFLRGTVAMLSGDGGLGKSLLLQQLCTAAALGRPWLGLDTKQCKTFAMFCEDDDDELLRRQASINAHYGCEMSDLEDVLYISRTGLENVLMDFDRRTDRPLPTPIFEQLRSAIADFGAQIIGLDTVADVFGGNEIVKNQVRRFITALRQMAMESQGVIILNSHPSLTGMNSGTGISGNVAWHNSVRSRLYLTKNTDNEEEEDNNERLLKTMKNNQGPFGGKLGIKWDRGVFVRIDESLDSPLGVVDRLTMDRDLIEGLRDLIVNGCFVPADKNARNGFANTVRSVPSCKKYTWGIIVSSQDRLVSTGKLTRVEMGPPSKRRVYIRPSDMLYPGEVAGETA